ncbi:PIN/TRAM domain-containing protein [Tepidanaerobacter sp. EBM-49]|uniref:PIN/TRAM domain-containing protein n=1 Tax=Tepidanaerobacter sp. EBM-49 TaxID=1918504 RepID=UPI000ADDA29E|nr:PIN/TRAM domain-containing protein [Tepidanaerobacter sp. EBM-49]
MQNKALRIIIAIIGLGIGFEIMSLLFYFNSYFNFFTFSYLTALIITLLGTLTSGIIFYFLSPRIINIFEKTSQWIENKLQKTPMQDILYGFFGMVMGLLLANLFNRAFLGIPWVGGYIPIILNIIMAYLGASVALKKKDELTNIIASSVGNLQKKKKKSSVISLVRPKILDTSVIIDGRIADICKTGFIEGTLVIPGFVLEELRHIADSSDSLKRNRGRRGLDILNIIQKEVDMEVEIYEGDFEDIAEVDSKLVKLAQLIDGCIITNDFNLNKVAEFQKVKVLNINELANALKPIVLPGEEMVVQVIKDGKESGQGIAYLDDGTMIVVDGGKKYIGETIEVLVTSVLQTAAGRMIFAKPKSA